MGKGVSPQWRPYHSSIHGCRRGWQLLRAKRRPKRKPLWCYQKRDNNLSDLGYATYHDYLSSPDWKKIRENLLIGPPKCASCKNPASQIHHTSYDLRTLLGLDMWRLVPLCRECHKEIEFDEGKKNTLRQANKKLKALISLNP